MKCVPKGSNQKFKLYRLAQIMQEQTDDEHYITMPEIMDELAKYNITADRKSLYNDLRDLSILGIDVEGEPIGNRYHYHVVNRAFELPELKYVESGVKTEFFENKIKYSISSGYIYPVYGAFRSLLKMNDETGEVEWVFDPIEIWNEVGVSIIQNVFETESNPQLVGKDKQLWLSNYRIVETQSLRKLLSERR